MGEGWRREKGDTRYMEMNVGEGGGGLKSLGISFSLCTKEIRVS